jgi:hypothetical protein
MKSIIKFESVLVMNGKQCLNAHGAVSMVGDAVRVVKCPKYIHEGDEQVFSPFIQRCVMVYFDEIRIYCVDLVSQIQRI